MPSLMLLGALEAEILSFIIIAEKQTNSDNIIVWYYNIQDYKIYFNIQGVPQNCIHFVFAAFSASRAPKEISEGIFW